MKQALLVVISLCLSAYLDDASTQFIAVHLAY